VTSSDGHAFLYLAQTDGYGNDIVHRSLVLLMFHLQNSPGAAVERKQRSDKGSNKEPHNTVQVSDYSMMRTLIRDLITDNFSQHIT
jgi:hypothetical protein